MTEKEKQVIRVCGENYKQEDIPAIWRKNEIPTFEEISGEIVSDEELVDMFGEGGKEEVEDFYDVKADYHPRPEQVV